LASSRPNPLCASRDCTYVAVKVIDGAWDDIFGAPNSATDEVVARGIRYAADNGAKVMNMSIGRTGPPAPVIEDAIRYAVGKGVFIAIAAGNDFLDGGADIDRVTYVNATAAVTVRLTAVTAQNTLGVQGVVELPPEFVAQQFDSVLSDIGTHAAKTGMLSSIPLVQTVSKKVQEYKLRQLVVDQVMVAKGGHPLLREEARRSLAETLLPLALVVTPNLHEAGLLAGMEVHNRTAMAEAARRIKCLGLVLHCR